MMERIEPYEPDGRPAREGKNDKAYRIIHLCFMILENKPITDSAV